MVGLQNKFDTNKKIIYTFPMSSDFASNGMSTFDLLGDLSPTQRTLTRILLRNIEMTESAIFEAVLNLPENKHMSKEEMQDALEVLVEKGWINLIGTDMEKVYTIKQQKNT